MGDFKTKKNKVSELPHVEKKKKKILLRTSDFCVGWNRLR